MVIQSLIIFSTYNKLKMKTRFVIANTPIRLPLSSTILYSFLLHYFNVSDIWWGVFITVFSIIWILIIRIKLIEEQIDISDLLNKEDPKQSTKPKSKFQERLNELMQDQKNNQTVQ